MLFLVYLAGKLIISDTREIPALVFEKNKKMISIYKELNSLAC